MPRPKPPPPDPADREWLDNLADAMLAEAVSATEPRIFSATGFARENISILHQQLRCANLAWALGWRARVTAGSVVGIVGGSFSGLMLAVALSLSNDAIVYIFEKEDRLLPRFLDKGHRHLSPVLNSRSLGHRFDPSFATPDFRSPIFAWTKGRASDVATQWLHEFESYDRTLPIFSFRGCEVQPNGITSRTNGLQIKLSGVNAEHWQPVNVDLLIDATGFGEEANPLRVVDFSYWEAGHRLIYDHVTPPADVLISGCGDSGVIEAFHYALQDFRHEDVEALWPLPGPDLDLDAGLEQARLDHVLRRGNLEDCEALPEISWWVELWWHLKENAHYDWLGAEPHTGPIFQTIEKALAPHLRKAFPGRKRVGLSWEERFKFAKELPLEVQFAIREAVRPVADVWISRGIEELANNFALPPQMAALRKMARCGVQVVLNGLMPTAYTRQLSPYNVWLLRLLLGLPHVSYRQGQISKVVRRKEDRRYDVTFKDGAVATFDRVVTRYGAGGGAGVVKGARRDTQGGDWLLDQSRYLAPDPKNPGKKRYFWSARETLAYALEDLQGPRAPLPFSDISKTLYVGRILLGPNGWPPDDPMHADPQTCLSVNLRSGQRATYEYDAHLERALKR